MTKKFPLTNWSEKKAFTIKLGAVKKYHIAVFADPNCPWCKRFFEENTDKLNDLSTWLRFSVKIRRSCQPRFCRKKILPRLGQTGS